MLDLSANTKIAAERVQFVAVKLEVLASRLERAKGFVGRWRS
jgi:hypothetical protein